MRGRSTTNPSAGAQSAAPASPDADIAAGARVLMLEASALTRLAETLGDSFVAALDRLGAVKGRVVITGIGKSGHVGRKIAATLASTGTPAMFVHTAEANHGDLGMITAGDAVLVLSNSGETEELQPLMAFTRRFKIPLIAITSRPDSSLARYADTVLALPDAAEACPMGLAPTTSTTLMLALGDAIAISLLERKLARNEFSPNKFRIFHPGGKLGRSLLPVCDLMHGADELPLVTDEQAMSDTLLVMTQKRFGCAGVVDGAGRLIGIITDGDLRRHMDNRLLDLGVREVMTPSPKTIAPDALAAEALGLMNESAITSLFVVESEKPVGILHIHDCLRAGVA
ncbi:MAG: KpsF/GutQ family sugar-phosphate isomerase [Alphaproteobacteria bacterium]